MLKKQFVSRGVAGIFVAILLVSVACSEDSSLPTSDASTTVQLTLNGLKPLENGSYYKAWAILDNSFSYSLGSFNFNEAGEMVTVTGDTLLSGEYTIGLWPEEIVGIGVSIEPVFVADIYYSHILGGAVSNGQAVLTIEDVLGIGVSFGSPTGKYVLATPTDGVDNNESSGIWFMDLIDIINVNGSNLPALPDQSAWQYEGWVLLNGSYVSTGKFSKFNAADDSARYSGSLPGPSFPGEDFLQNAPAGLSFPANLAGASIMITVEPSKGNDDNLEKPFFIKVLQADIPQDATVHVPYDMTAGTEPMPSGTAIFK